MKRVHSPKSGYEHYLLAYALRQLGREVEAYQQIIHAIKSEPTNPTYVGEWFNHRASFAQVEHLQEICDKTHNGMESANWFQPSISLFSKSNLDEVVLYQLVQERAAYHSAKDLNLNAWENQLKLDTSGNASLASIGDNGTLDNLIGHEGMRSPTIGSLFEYVNFLNNLNFFKKFPTHLVDLLSKDKLWSTDLGTLVDIAFVESSLTTNDSKKIIFEIGGGYGRLAEGLYQFSKQSISKYILIDSVPGSMASAYKYLTEYCSEWKVQLLEMNSQIDPDATVVICPSWNLSALESLTPDIVINIESIQEMSKEYESFWIDWIDSMMDENTIIYWSNSRSYRNKGQWYIPRSWSLNLISETPRSWTDDHFSALFSIDKKVATSFSMKDLYSSWKVETLPDGSMPIKIV